MLTLRSSPWNNEMWKQISLSKFKVKAVEVMKLLIFSGDVIFRKWALKDREEFWEHTRVREGIPGRSNSVFKGTKVYVWVLFTLEESDGWVGRTGSYSGSLHQGWELRLYLMGIPKPLELDVMLISFFWAVWPCFSVASPTSGSVAKPKLVFPTTSGSLLQSRLTAGKLSTRIIRKDLTLYFRKNPSLTCYSFGGLSWPEVGYEASLLLNPSWKEFDVYPSHLVNLDVHFIAPCLAVVSRSYMIVIIFTFCYLYSFIFVAGEANWS